MHTNFLLLPLLIALTKARFLHSLPDDPHAFPKFRVVFLNNQPVLNSTAERWLAQGLSKGEPEFLEHTWTPVHSLNRIEGGGQSEDPGVANRVRLQSLSELRTLSERDTTSARFHVPAIPSRAHEPRP